MKKNFILKVWFVLCLLFLSQMPVLAAVGDHVSWLDLWYEVQHENPLDVNDVQYSFDFEIGTDANVVRIEFITPQGRSFEIPNSPDNWDDVNQIWTNREFDEGSGLWEWDFCKESDDANVFDDFGDGVYTLTFFYAGDSNEQTQVLFADPGTSQPIPMPTQIPQIISPAYRSSVSSPVTMSWQECTDPNVNSLWVEMWDESTDEGVESELPKAQISWGPHDIDDGYWQAGICFDNVNHIFNADGIEVWYGKTQYAEHPFAVGVQWTAYEVWAGNTDYSIYPNWWEYYHSIDQYDYVKLGQSYNGESITVSGDYDYYVIASHEPVLIDAVQGSTGEYVGLYAPLWDGGCENWDNIRGEPDGLYMTVGHIGFGGSFCGFVRITNPGDWGGITTIAGAFCSEPLVGDLDGDCRVDFTDFAMMAENWLKCNLVPADACW